MKEKIGQHEAELKVSVGRVTAVGTCMGNFLVIINSKIDF